MMAQIWTQELDQMTCGSNFQSLSFYVLQFHKYVLERFRSHILSKTEEQHWKRNKNEKSKRNVQIWLRENYQNWPLVLILILVKCVTIYFCRVPQISQCLHHRNIKHRGKSQKYFSLFSLSYP